MPSCYSGNNRTCCLYSVVEVLWIGWLFVSWVSFGCLRLHVAKALVFTTFFSSVTLRQMYQSCFFVVRSANMAKYGPLSSPLDFLRGFLIFGTVLCTNPLLRELWTGSLVYEIPWFWKLLKLMWTILGSIVTKYYFRYAIFGKYTFHMSNDYIWWGIL